MWEKKSDDGGLHDKDNTYFWDLDEPSIWAWLNDINTEGGTGFAGYNDWRFPNVKELQSIVNFEIVFPGPVVSPAFNTNCTPGATVLTGSCTARSRYWSSTTVPTLQPFFPENAWFVGFNGGHLTGAGVGADTKFLDRNHVRAVRGGSNLGSAR